MSNELRRSELIRIYNIVVDRLTPKHINWLKIHRPVMWKKIDFDNRSLMPYDKGYIHYVRLVDGERDFLWKNDISFRIQDMIDAVNNETELTPEIGLTRPMMEYIAIFLGVQDKPHANKFQILGAILEVGEKN